MKIAIIVLSGGVTNAHNVGQPYDDLVTAIKETWAQDKPSNVDIFYNYALIQGFAHNPAPNETKIVGDLLIHGIDEVYENMHRKVIHSMAHFGQHTDYDYVFRCCCGSYVHIENLVKFLEDKPRDRFYCGVPTNYNDGSKNFMFASGSGFFFSKDLLKVMHNHLHELANNEVRLDDTTIGYYFGKWGIPIWPGKRRDIGDLPENRSHLINLNCLTKEDRKHYHFHMRHNAEGMRHLHSLFKNKKYC